MKRYLLHEPFNIYHFKAETWAHPLHNHTYFEIIFILKGTGTHTINGNRFNYKSGDVFLLGPADYHSFSIKTMTEFCYIRFLESFSTYTSLDNDKRWQQTIELLLHSSFQSKGSIVQRKNEKKKLFSLLTILEEEYDNRHAPGFDVLRDSLMKSIMAILARNLTYSITTREPVDRTSSVEEILFYIRQHIQEPKNLRIDNLSKKFHLAPAYLGIYFKKHTGEPLKQYIIKYKLKLIETRLLHSNVNLASIADEFGFTDESHLCKQFRKYTGVAPGDFRNKKTARQKN